MKSSVTRTVAVCAVSGAVACGLSASAVQPAAHSQPARAFLAETPMYFEAHEGQTFLARGIDCSIAIRATDATLMLSRRGSASPWPFGHKVRMPESEGESRTVTLGLLGANSAAVASGAERLSAKANYLVGNDASQWQTGVPLYSKVQVKDVYPGIDVIYYAEQAGRLEYDFVLQPAADPNRIAFKIKGADHVSIDADGGLVLKVGSEEIRQPAPVIYQERNGMRRSVAGGYRMDSPNTVGFRVEAYDRQLPLVIDPVLSFSTYLGGSKAEYGWAVAVDGANNIYVAGETLSKTLPGGTNSVFQPAYGGGIGAFGDGFVAKYDGATRSLSWLTYFGGKTDDGILGMTVDEGSGAVYITGFTDSRNFPILPAGNAMSTNTLIRSGRTNNAFRIYPVNAFVARLNPSGSALDFSVLMGGNRRESGTGIALDSGDVFVTGMTESTNFYPTPAGKQTLHAGNGDAFVVRLTNLSDPVPAYSTYLGGTNLDYAEGIAVRSQEAYITGFTTSTNFPVVNPLTFTNASYTNAIVLNRLNMQPKRTSRMDGFVTKVSAAGDDWIYSTYLGATNDDSCLDIKVDTAGNAYVAGYTLSRWFPTNAIAMPRSTGTNYNSHAFVTKIGAAGSNLVYSVDFGSSRSDRATTLALDEARNRVYVAGFTGWNNFFATNILNDLRSTNAMARRNSKTPYETFVVALEENGGNVTFTNATLLGGIGNDQPYGIAVKEVAGTVTAWIAGQTTSQDFVVTNSYPPFQVQTNLGNLPKKTKVADAFLTELQFPEAP